MSKKNKLHDIVINIIAGLLVVGILKLLDFFSSTTRNIDIDHFSLNDFYFIWEYRHAIMSGLIYTVFVSLLSIIAGTLIA
ncbi:MAG: hypothetical protein AAF611_18740, partial [Bacteroidota bacterium]